MLGLRGGLGGFCFLSSSLLISNTSTASSRDLINSGLIKLPEAIAAATPQNTIRASHLVIAGRSVSSSWLMAGSSLILVLFYAGFRIKLLNLLSIPCTYLPGAGHLFYVVGFWQHGPAGIKHGRHLTILSHLKPDFLFCRAEAVGFRNPERIIFDMLDLFRPFKRLPAISRAY